MMQKRMATIKLGKGHENNDNVTSEDVDYIIKKLKQQQPYFEINCRKSFDSDNKILAYESFIQTSRDTMQTLKELYEFVLR